MNNTNLQRRQQGGQPESMVAQENDTNNISKIKRFVKYDFQFYDMVVQNGRKTQLVLPAMADHNIATADMAF